MKKSILLFTLIAMALLVSACTNSTSANRRYYTGYDSVEMRFMTESPPSEFYYDSESGAGDNTIPIVLELKNKGSSDTLGAVFIHGFDPNIVSVDTNDYGYVQARARYASGVGTNLAINAGGVNLGYNNRGGSSYTYFGFGDDRNKMYLGLAAQNSKLKRVDFGYMQGKVGAFLNGISASMFMNYGWLKVFSLEGNSPLSPGGGTEVIEFPASIYYLPDSLEQFRQRVMVTSCFDYATHATAMMCIDPNPNNNNKKVCKPQTVSLGGGQGAPVAITAIEQKASKSKTIFTIRVHHNKKNVLDDVYDYFSLYKCDPESGEIIKATDKNVVYVGYVVLGNQDITMGCQPDQKIRLDDAGNGEIICTAYTDTGSNNAYESPLEIELWYGYSKSIYKDIIIKKI